MEQQRKEELAVHYVKDRALRAADHKLDNILVRGKFAQLVPNLAPSFVKEKAMSVLRHKLDNHLTQEKAGEFALLFIKKRLASKQPKEGEDIRASLRKNIERHGSLLKEHNVSPEEVVEFIREVAPEQIAAAC